MFGGFANPFGGRFAILSHADAEGIAFAELELRLSVILFRSHAIPLDGFRLVLLDAVACLVAPADSEQLLHGLCLQHMEILLLHVIFIYSLCLMGKNRRMDTACHLLFCISGSGLHRTDCRQTSKDNQIYRDILDKWHEPYT